MTEKADNEVIINLRKLIELAREGRKEVLPVLQRALDQQPSLWESTGNLAQQVQSNWLELLGGQDLFIKEAMGRHAAALREELAGPDATALERLQVERIVALNLQLGFYEMLLAKHEPTATGKVLDHLYERCGVADRRFQQAVQNLAKIRKLLPRVLKVDVVISGEIETTLKDSGTPQKELPSSNGSTRISVPENRIKDLLAAAQN